MQSTRGVLALPLSIVVAIAACGTGDNRVDPRDLELRDLLGVTPDAALAWNAAQRAAARDVLADGASALGDEAPAIALALDARRPIDDRVARAIGALDRDRAAGGAGALGIVRVAIQSGRAELVARPMATALAAPGAPPAVELWLSDAWESGDRAQLPARGLDVLASIAASAGHTTGPVVVAPSPQLGAIAAYVTSGERPRLVVNPVLLAALEPVEPAEATARTRGLTTAATAAPPAAMAPAVLTAPAAPSSAPIDPDSSGVIALTNPTGNPYSFYGSIAECAFAQRTRCESCLSAGNCKAITNTSDGNAECTQLAAGDGRGYHLICINLAVAIASVDLCTADAAPGCASDNNAASDLGKLEANANFFAEATCRTALDACLADIYGPPPGEFPEPGPDGGGAPPPRPPRETNVDCDDSCDDDKNENCEASPSCNCEGPSCNNSFSCDSTCSSSNDSSGCSESCPGDSSGESGGCSDDGGDGGSSGDSGGCGDDSSGGGGDSCSSDDGGSSDSSCGGDGGCGGDSCGSDSGGSGGDGCGGDGGGCGGDGGGCGGDSGGGGGCSGGDGGGCGGSSGGGGCGGGGSSSNGCNAARRTSSPATGWLVSLAWALLPVPFAALIRRRSRKRADKDEEEASEPAASTADRSGDDPDRGEIADGGHSDCDHSDRADPARRRPDRSDRADRARRKPDGDDRADSEEVDHGDITRGARDEEVVP